AEIVLQRSPQIPDTMAVEPAADGLRQFVLGLPSDLQSRQHDQHRNPVGVRDCLRGNYGYAQNASRDAAALQDAAGTAGADPRDYRLFRDDGIPRQRDMDPAGGLASDRVSGVLRLQPDP